METASGTTSFERLRGSQFAFNLAELALDFLLCPERQEHAADAAATRSEASSFAQDSPHLARFLRRFLDLHHEWAREDATAAFEMLRARCRTLVDWIDAVLTLCDVELQLDGDEPYVAVRNSSGWAVVASSLDPEAIVSFILAKADGSGASRGLSPQALVPKISDRGLQAIERRGVTDYHVHLGGIRSAQALWRQVLSRHLPLNRVRRFSKAELDGLSGDERRQRLAERARVQALAEELDDPSSPLGAFVRPVARCRTNPERITAEVVRERQMFAVAWAELLRGRSSDGNLPPRLVALERQLDLYLFQKHQFLSWHRQPADSNPGLLAFRIFYRATEPVWPSAKFLPPRYERGPRIQAQSLAEYAAHIAQSRHLRRIELRMAPLDSPSAYHRFFRAWSVVENEFELAKAAEIGFAIHFKRSLDGADMAGRKGKAPRSLAGAPKENAATLRIARFLRVLDRDTAMLHAYRRGPRWRTHANRIVRIDFAGAERDIPISLASFCMKLARSDRGALAQLNGAVLHPKLHRFWLWHAARGTQNSALEMPMLGQTAHAGEDFAHPAEGLYSVAMACSTLGMREGDTIGHGLALGWDIGKFDRTRSPRTLTVRGNQFDALFWLLRELRAETGLAQPERLRDLADWVAREFAALYELNLPVSVVEDIDKVRADGIAAAEPAAAGERMRYQELFNADCCRRRAERVPLAPVLYDLAPALAALQLKCRERLAEQGIVLEFNPSSNLRVSGSGHDEMPFMALLKAARANILATVNSDNPGVFATRIENEYALAFQALRNAGFSRAESLAVIERVRDVGERLVYWPLEHEDSSRGRAS